MRAGSPVGGQNLAALGAPAAAALLHSWSGTAWVPGGSITASLGGPAIANSQATLAQTAQAGPAVHALGWAYDSVGANWVRVPAATPGDTINNPSFAIDCLSRQHAYDGAQWSRVTGLNSGTLAFGGAYSLITIAQGYSRDVAGASWVANRSIAPADALAAPAFALQTLSCLQAFNGTTYDRLRNDTDKRLRVVHEDPDIAGADGDPSVYTVAGANSGASIIGAAAKLLAFYVTNPDIDGWLMFFNKASGAANGDTAILQFAMDVADAEPLSKILHLGRDFFGPSGKKFATGLAWALSSTKDTLTLATPAAGFTLNVLYRS